MDSDQNYLLLSNLIPITAQASYIIMLVAVLLLIAALIAAAEIAIYLVTPKELDDFKKYSTARSMLISKYIDAPDIILATVRVSKAILNFSVVIISTLYVAGLVFIEGYHPVFFALQLLTLLIFILLIEEKLPRFIVGHHAIRYAKWIIFPIHILVTFLKPLLYLMDKDSTVSERIIQNKYKISLNNLEEILDFKTVETKDKNIIQGVLNFKDTDVKEIMKSRIDVVSIDEKTTIDNVVSIANESGYSRIPVYAESFDHVKGILYVKDLWYNINQHPNKEFEWQKLIRPAYFVPESKKISDLLSDFQRKKMHMAIVNDEYGGTYGIVTLEDIVEEIVGDINDESDEEEFYFTKIDEQNFLFEGKVLMNDFYRFLDIKDNVFDEIEGDSETLAGLILDIKGEMPSKHEIIQFKNFTFKIESVDNRRISQIKVTIEPLEEDEDKE